MPKIKQAPPAPEAPAPVAAGPAPYIPQFAEQERSRAPRLGKRAPWLYKYHPERWTVIQGRAVPQLGAMKLIPGVESVRATREGKLVKGQAQAIQEEQGWLVIPADVDGPGTSYLHEAAPGVFLSRWERAFPSSSHVDVDETGHAQWLESLVDRGVLPPPEPYVLEKLRAKVQRDLDDVADRLAGAPSARPLVERLQRDLEAIDTARKKWAPAQGYQGAASDLSDLLGDE